MSESQTQQHRPMCPAGVLPIDQPIGGPRTPEQEALNAITLAEIDRLANEPV